jgi:hypothetical protein
MGFIKQLVFYLGMLAGVATFAAAAGVLLTYLFTGKLPSVQASAGEQPRVRLMTPDELVTLFRQQANKAEAAVEAPISTGG